MLVAGAVALEHAAEALEDVARGVSSTTIRSSRSAALFFLSPLVVVSYIAIGFYGLIFFFVPLLLIKEASAKYIALERAKDELISSERLAAKGKWPRRSATS